MASHGGFRHGGHWRRWGIIGLCVVLVGVALGLGLSHILDESPSHATSTTSGSSNQQQAGNGPGIKVAHPPGPNTGVVPGQKVLAANQSGLCRVNIRDHYNKYLPDDQVKCAGEWDGYWLVTMRNDSSVPVFVNEWYFGDWHGQTTILPYQTAIVPLFGTPFSTALFVGACWTGSGGPGTCQAGAANKFANVSIVHWSNVSPDPRRAGQLWFREQEGIAVSARTGPVVAMNNSPFPIELHWPALGRDIWVTVNPKGHSGPIPAPDLEGRKAFGNGEVAVVTLAPTGPGEDPEHLYRLITPTYLTGVPPYAEMTWLGVSYCSVHLQNLSSHSISLFTWYFPGYLNQSGPGLTLGIGQSGTLTMRSGTALIAGHVGTAVAGEFATVKATDWKKC
jgi:hypothetical protein